MYKSKTTFVVGAGASLELEFPTSDKLKEQISEAVNIRYDGGNNQINGDFAIGNSLTKYANYRDAEGAKEYNKYLHAGWHIAKAMPQAISIDNFIEVQKNEYVTRIAKLGITAAIIDAEKACWDVLKKEETDQDICWDKFRKIGFIIFVKL